VLAWETRVRANASYDAFKIISVFFPGLLAAVCCWMAAAQSSRRSVHVAACALAVALLIANLAVAAQFRRQMSVPPLRVDRYLAEVGKLENDPKVHSLNLRIDDFWSRLWANYFLLRKPQYFPTHTYEGRKNTVLRGEWDLRDDLFRTRPADAGDYIALNTSFYSVRAGKESGLQAEFAEGWFAWERSGSQRWRWSESTARIRLINPTGQPMRVELRLSIRAAAPRVLRLRCADLVAEPQPMDGSKQEIAVGPLTLPPGESVLLLETDKTAVQTNGSDPRPIAVALYGFELRPVPQN
jgi:hypothetical protein